MRTVRDWLEKRRIDGYQYQGKWMIYERELHRVKELKKSA